jgi:hypothetical protein
VTSSAALGQKRASSWATFAFLLRALTNSGTLDDVPARLDLEPTERRTDVKRAPRHMDAAMLGELAEDDRERLF